jgi:hypothetical protein
LPDCVPNGAARCLLLVAAIHHRCMFRSARKGQNFILGSTIDRFRQSLSRPKPRVLPTRPTFGQGYGQPTYPLRSQAGC